MIVIYELRCPLPVLIKRGDEWVKGMAHLVIDPGFEQHLQWQCWVDDTRESRVVQNPDIRIRDNLTAGREPKKVVTFEADGVTPRSSVITGGASSIIDRSMDIVNEIPPFDYLQRVSRSNPNVTRCMSGDYPR